MSLTGPLLHRIKINSVTNCSFYLNIQLFSHEVLHRKNNFTAAGFFDMDYKLITSVCCIQIITKLEYFFKFQILNCFQVIAAVTTYLLIIIQFHFSNIQNKILITPE